MNSTPNWESLFNKVDNCSMCGENWSDCDCRKDDMPDFDSYDDEPED